MRRKEQLLSRIGLVAVGVLVGLLARFVIGPPATGTGPKRTIDRPMPEVSLEEMGEVLLPIDIPLDNLPLSERSGRTP